MTIPAETVEQAEAASLGAAAELRWRLAAPAPQRASVQSPGAPERMVAPAAAALAARHEHREEWRCRLVRCWARSPRSVGAAAFGAVDDREPRHLAAHRSPPRLLGVRSGRLVSTTGAATEPPWPPCSTQDRRRRRRETTPSEQRIASAPSQVRSPAVPSVVVNLTMGALQTHIPTDKTKIVVAMMPASGRSIQRSHNQQRRASAVSQQRRAVRHYTVGTCPWCKSPRPMRRARRQREPMLT